MGKTFLSGGEEFNKYSLKRHIEQEVSSRSVGAPYLEIDWQLQFSRNDNKFLKQIFHKGATFKLYDKDGNNVSVSNFSLVAVWATPLHSLNNQGDYWFDAIHTAYTNTIILGASMPLNQFIEPSSVGEPNCLSLFTPSDTELEVWYSNHPGYYPLYGNVAIDEMQAVFSFLITHASYKFVPVLSTGQKYYKKVILFDPNA